MLLFRTLRYLLTESKWRKEFAAATTKSNTKVDTTYYLNQNFCSRGTDHWIKVSNWLVLKTKVGRSIMFFLFFLKRWLLLHLPNPPKSSFSFILHTFFFLGMSYSSVHRLKTFLFVFLLKTPQLLYVVAAWCSKWRWTYNCHKKSKIFLRHGNWWGYHWWYVTDH